MLTRLIQPDWSAWCVTQVRHKVLQHEHRVIQGTPASPNLYNCNNTNDMAIWWRWSMRLSPAVSLHSNQVVSRNDVKLQNVETARLAIVATICSGEQSWRAGFFIALQLWFRIQVCYLMSSCQKLWVSCCYVLFFLIPPLTVLTSCGCRAVNSTCIPATCEWHAWVRKSIGQLKRLGQRPGFESLSKICADLQCVVSKHGGRFGRQRFEKHGCPCLRGESMAAPLTGDFWLRIFS